VEEGLLGEGVLNWDELKSIWRYEKGMLVGWLLWFVFCVWLNWLIG
jgi:hypothetical protein